ncbi:MAG: dihydroorotate dehydrogenase-like protein, partial [Candidatus Methylomirabilis sp.]|nr:dihydroorotate dehydrogenase-like protein [Deltaproteobacteria bacterium]
MSADLSTRYLGLPLRGPLAAAASPLTGELDSLRRLEDAGASAVTLPSLFEEQIEHEEMELHRLQEFGAESYGEARDYFPELESSDAGPDRYLRLIEAAKGALAIPVFASLNGHTAGGWVRYAKLFEEAGADAVELNVYEVPTDPEADADAVERAVVHLVGAVRREVR